MTRWITLLALTGLLAGCGSDSNSTGNPDQAPMTATVNGSAFLGNTSGIATRLAGVVNISEFNAAKTQEILLTVHANGPGTYSFASPSVGIAEFETMSETSAQQWETGFNGGTGSITFTTLDASGASGTFSFTGAAVQGTGATGTATVTSGKFNVIF
ncbi:MAG: DUF6252 family protein [Gemmatimonadales bacterium]